MHQHLPRTFNSGRAAKRNSRPCWSLADNWAPAIAGLEPPPHHRRAGQTLPMKVIGFSEARQHRALAHREPLPPQHWRSALLPMCPSPLAAPAAVGKQRAAATALSCRRSSQEKYNEQSSALPVARIRPRCLKTQVRQRDVNPKRLACVRRKCPAAISTSNSSCVQGKRSDKAINTYIAISNDDNFTLDLQITY